MSSAQARGLDLKPGSPGGSDAFGSSFIKMPKVASFWSRSKTMRLCCLRREAEASRDSLKHIHEGKLAMSNRAPCHHCAKITERHHWLLGIPLCKMCELERRETLYKCITKGTARNMGIPEGILEELPCLKLDNPHCRSAPPMKLYFMRQIEEVILVCGKRRQRKNA